MLQADLAAQRVAVGMRVPVQNDRFMRPNLLHDCFKHALKPTCFRSIAGRVSTAEPIETF